MPSSIKSSSHTTASSYNTFAATQTAADFRHLTFHAANATDAHSMPGTALLPSANFIKSSQRLVRPKTGKFLFKSQSTPHLRGRHMMSDSELAKRNKLGYQRISIACAHCRRRKIRCLIAEDAADGRCANCIRLKKECVFYPVDQQAAIDAQGEQSDKPNNPSGQSSPVSNSPRQAATRPPIPQDRSRGSSHPGSSTDEQIAYRGISIAPNHSQPPLGSMSAPIPQPGQFEQSNGYFTPIYAYPPPGEANAPEHHAPNFSRPLLPASPHIAQSVYGHPPPGADTAPYAFSSAEEVPQYTYSPVVSYEYASHPSQHQQWPVQPQPIRSMSYSGSVSPYPQHQPSPMYPSPFSHSASHEHSAPHPQHDPRLVQYPTHHAPPPPGHQPYLTPMSSAPAPAPLASQPQYPPHYHPAPPVQPLQSNWFGGPIDDAAGRNRNVQTSQPG